MRGMLPAVLVAAVLTLGLATSSRAQVAPEPIPSGGPSAMASPAYGYYGEDRSAYPVVYPSASNRTIRRTYPQGLCVYPTHYYKGSCHAIDYYPPWAVGPPPIISRFCGLACFPDRW